MPGSSSARSIELGRSLELVPGCSYFEFAQDVGIKSAHHLGEVLRGNTIRRSCNGWQGLLLSGPLPVSAIKSNKGSRKRARQAREEAGLPYKPRRRLSARLVHYLICPEQPDQQWQAGCMSAQLARSLLPQDCAAMARFLEHAGVEGIVSLDVLFPGSVLEVSMELGTALDPCCSPTQFAKDVGISSVSHLGEAVRGKRQSCQGWRGHQSFIPEALPEHQMTVLTPLFDSAQQDPLMLCLPAIECKQEIDIELFEFPFNLDELCLGAQDNDEFEQLNVLRGIAHEIPEMQLSGSEEWSEPDFMAEMI